MDIRTDLAVESREIYLNRNSLKELPGVLIETEENKYYKIKRVKIKNDEAAEKLGKPKGNYITIHSEHISTGLFTKELSEALSNELLRLIPKANKKSLAFVAGLGNDNVTPDALGPLTLSSLIVTRHLFNSGEKNLNDLSPLCALAPGVLGVTGIESAEIFKAVTDRIKPDFVIAVDALASGSSSHVGTTIQLSDTGINPGSGVHNRRSSLNEETLGVKVIALGVPTVSDSKSIIYSVLSHLIDDEAIDKLMIDESLNSMVTPKNIDAIIDRASAILSGGINLAIHKNLDYSDLSLYTS